MGQTARSRGLLPGHIVPGCNIGTAYTATGNLNLRRAPVGGSNAHTAMPVPPCGRVVMSWKRWRTWWWSAVWLMARNWQRSWRNTPLENCDSKPARLHQAARNLRTYPDWWMPRLRDLAERRAASLWMVVRPTLEEFGDTVYGVSRLKPSRGGGEPSPGDGWL